MRWIKWLSRILIGGVCVWAGLVLYGYHLTQQCSIPPVAIVGRNQRAVTARRHRLITQAAYPHTLARGHNPAYAQALIQADQYTAQQAIGLVCIPAVKIILPIFPGTSDFALLNGVGTYWRNQRLGQGNYVVAAHNLSGQKALLNPMTVVKPGQQIYLTDFVHLATYTAVSNRVVTDRHSELLAVPGPHQPAEVTLFRCVGGIGTPWREVLQGRLTSEQWLNQAAPALLRQMRLTVNGTVTAYQVSRSRSATPLARWGLTNYQNITHQWGWAVGVLIAAWLIDVFSTLRQRRAPVSH